MTMAQAKVLYVVHGRRRAAHVRARRPPRRRLVVGQRAGRPPRRARPAAPPRRPGRSPPGRGHDHAGGRRAARAVPRAQSAPAARAADAPRRRGARHRRPLDRHPRPSPSTEPSPPPIQPSRPPISGGASRESPQPPRRQQAERDAPVRGGPLRRRDLGLGQPQAGAPAGHRVPGHHRRHAVPGRRLVRRARAGHAPDRARRRRGAAARVHPVDLVQLDLAGRHPVLVRDRRAKATTAAIEDALSKAKLPDTAAPTVQALNINASPVVISSIAATSPDGLERGRDDRPDARSSPRSRRSRASPGPT